jgi:hypothetical protein
VRPNPAIQANVCHIVLVEGCVACGEMQLDANEEIELSLLPIDEVLARAERGEIKHSLVVDALFYLRAWREGGDARLNAREWAGCRSSDYVSQ